MRFLADENVPCALVQVLRQAGHHVDWVRTDAPGAPDILVIERAMRDGRILVTFDKDFGELARSVRADTVGFGVILVRSALGPSSSGYRQVAAVIASRDDWVSHFSVIEPGRVRMKPLAPSR